MKLRLFIKEIMFTLFLIAGEGNWSFHSSMVQENRHLVKVIHSCFDETKGMGADVFFYMISIRAVFTLISY